MEEIEVGEYVRTKKGIARRVEDGKFVEIRENGNRMYYVDTNGTPCTWEFSCYIWSKDIAKHSKNIIDLIEVGDYVNGKPVHKYNGSLGIIAINQLGWTFIAFKDGTYPIEFVVTKEQFANMEYKVRE